MWGVFSGVATLNRGVPVDCFGSAVVIETECVMGGDVDGKVCMTGGVEMFSDLWM